MLQMEHCERADDGEIDVIAPLRSVTITLDVSSTELELAVATSGKSFCPAMMIAIIICDGGRYGVARCGAIGPLGLQFSLSAFPIPIAARM